MSDDKRYVLLPEFKYLYHEVQEVRSYPQDNEYHLHELVKERYE